MHTPRPLVYRIGVADPPLILRDHPRDPAAFAAFATVAEPLGREVDALVDAPMPTRPPEATGRCLVCGATLPARATGRPRLYCETVGCRRAARAAREARRGVAEAEHRRRLDRRDRYFNAFLAPVIRRTSPAYRGRRLTSEVERTESAPPTELLVDGQPWAVAAADLGWSADGVPEVYFVGDGRIE